MIQVNPKHFPFATKINKALFFLFFALNIPVHVPVYILNPKGVSGLGEQTKGATMVLFTER